MQSSGSDSRGSRVERRIALALCGAVVVADTAGQLVSNRPGYAAAFAPGWITLAAAGFAAAGIGSSDGHPRWRRVRLALQWSGLLLMVWAASGLPLHLLRATGLIPLPVDWPGLATKTLALAAAVMLARLALARPAAPTSTPPARWYGYTAFVLALPYPVLRAWWALGGTLGLSRPGAAGEGYAPLVLAIPWVLAAALSLLLVPTRSWMPRRLLLVAGWTATAIVGTIGPAACWALVSAWMTGAPAAPPPPGAKPSGIAFWVFALFYGSWFLWAIAAGAATRSYQVRSARAVDGRADVTVRAMA